MKITAAQIARSAAIRLAGTDVPTFEVDGGAVPAFEVEGAALIAPEAVGRRWLARVPVARDGNGNLLAYGLRDGVAIVAIEGPLSQRGGWYYDGYDAVAERTRAALADPATRAVLLKINSPGGMAAGVFEAVRAMRAASAAAGKPIVAYVDEQALSAGYALACAATAIYLPATGQVGSVGVLSVLVDRTAANQAAGLRVDVVRSGTEKADTCPDLPTTDEVLAREQAVVDALARQFAELVAAARGMTPEAVLGLQAGIRWGHAAVAARLADGVLTFDECCARALSHSPAAAPPAAPTTRTTMDDLKKKLEQITGAGTDDEIIGRVSAYKDAHAKLPGAQARVTELETAERTAREAGEREKLITKALDERKLTPDEAAKIRAGEGWSGTLSTDQLRAMLAERAPVATAPETAVRGARGTSARVEAGASTTADEVTLSAEEERIARQMGNDLEEVLAAKRARLGAEKVPARR